MPPAKPTIQSLLNQTKETLSPNSSGIKKSRIPLPSSRLRTLDKTCSVHRVLGSKTIQLCPNTILCEIHTEEEKRQVKGRTMGYEILVASLRKRVEREKFARVEIERIREVEKRERGTRGESVRGAQLKDGLTKEERKRLLID